MKCITVKRSVGGYAIIMDQDDGSRTYGLVVCDVGSEERHNPLIIWDIAYGLMYQFQCDVHVRLGPRHDPVAVHLTHNPDLECNTIEDAFYLIDNSQSESRHE